MKTTLAVAALLGYTNAHGLLEKITDMAEGAKNKWNHHKGDIKEHWKNHKGDFKKPFGKFNGQMQEWKNEWKHAEEKFQEHLNDHGISYGTKEEYKFRLGIFKKDLEFVEEWNANTNNTHTVETNFMSTWTQDERKRLNGYVHPENFDEIPIKDFEPVVLGDTVNWNTQGAVTPIKNQGQCGSCWSFSTTGAMEGAHFIAKHELLSLSESQLVDCDMTDNGCNGGSMANAMFYTEQNPLMLESAYPYVPKRETCKYSESQGKVSATNVYTTRQKVCTDLKQAITQQPVSIAIEADKSVFQLYKTGVLTSSECGTSLDHGVLAVGYGNEGGQDYVLVKNSWGASWGDNGFVKLGCTDESAGTCGCAMSPYLPSTD